MIFPVTFQPLPLASFRVVVKLEPEAKLKLIGYAIPPEERDLSKVCQAVILCA